MTRIARLAIPAALAFAAFGVGAQTIETDYPVVGGHAVASSSGASGSQASFSEPYLIQSNAEGVRVNPEFARASTVSRAEVQRKAVVQALQSAGHNA